MSRRRAALPKVENRHLRGLQILNETGYDTRAIRSLVVRCLRAQGMRVIGAVRIVYSSVSGHHGCAALGDSIHRQGLNMALSLPRDPAEMSVTKFALVVRHEVMHWRGVQHADMTEAQLYCQGPLPAWAEGVAVGHRARTEPTKDEQLLKKCMHAHEMFRRAETRLKRAETIVKRWRLRVAAAERALERSERSAEPMLALPAQEAADREPKP